MSLSFHLNCYDKAEDPDKQDGEAHLVQPEKPGLAKLYDHECRLQ